LPASRQHFLETKNSKGFQGINSIVERKGKGKKKQFNVDVAILEKELNVVA
jgi:hypothetical protein